jgi:hypothetical protein
MTHLGVVPQERWSRPGASVHAGSFRKRLDRTPLTIGRLAQSRRSSRRSVRPVRRSSRRSVRPVRRSLRRCMPGVPVVGGGVTGTGAGVWAPACDAVRTAAGAARPSTAAHPMRERARRREIKSEVMISLISITPMSVVQQNP